MGVVYEAEQVSLGRRVALKVLPLAAALDPRQLQRFRLEAQAAAHLHHAHIVAIHAVGCEHGVYHYAMQYVEGRSLADLIAQLQHQRSQPAMPPAPAVTPPGGAQADTAAEAHAATVRSVGDSAYFRTVAALGIQAAEALEYAHGMGVIHRDIKPANLLLDAQGNLFVTDFGLAQLRGVPELTMTGDLVGTLRYMSPEQTLAQRGVLDHRTDIYSLGATLYELLTLAPAFGAPDRHALLRQIAEEDPLPPRHRQRAIPVDLETIVLKAMVKEPASRYATARELADDLRGFLEHRPIRARRPTVVERSAKWARRHRPLVAAAVGLLLLAAVGFGISTALVAREQRDTQRALNQLAAEQARTKAALDSEAEQRARAEMSFRQARQVVDFFTEASEEELADKPELQGLRRTLLAAALQYYQKFIDQCRDDPSLQTQLAASHLRVATILDQIGSRADALAALERARQIQEKLVHNRPTTQEFQWGLFAIYNRLGSLRGGRELHLLGQKSVQEDLRLSEEQVRKITNLRDQRREAFRDPRHHPTLEEWDKKFEELAAQEKTLTELLQPEQARRLRQIALQQRGNDAFTDPEVEAALSLTALQKETIRDIQDKSRQEIGAAFQAGDFGPEGWKKIEDLRNKARSQILELLSDGQKAQWNELAGAPFKGRLRPWHPGGFGPPPVARGPRPAKD
jgi:tetratricopeptide (TPR) repeat protein